MYPLVYSPSSGESVKWSKGRSMTFCNRNPVKAGCVLAAFMVVCVGPCIGACRASADGAHSQGAQATPTTNNDKAADAEAVVHVTRQTVGRITLGTGWTVWCHRGKMGEADAPDYSLTWTDAQWDAYFRLLKRSGADWLGLDLYYGDAEPQSPDATPDHKPHYDFATPRLRYLYKFLDFAQKNDVHVRLYYTFLLSPHRYKADPATGWLSRFATNAHFAPDAFAHSSNTEEGAGDTPLDRKRLRDNLVATAVYLIRTRHYTCVKQLCLYCEPDVGWKGVNGWEDNRELGRAMERAGLRDKMQILAPDSYHQIAPTPGEQVDIVAYHDYDTHVDFAHPERGLQGQPPISLRDFVMAAHQDAAQRNRQAVAALTEYGNWGAGPIQLAAHDPMPAYLGTLSSACFVFALYNAGFAGTLRWSFDPMYHPYDGFAAIQTQPCAYPNVSGPAANGATFRALSDAWKQGAKCVEFAPTFEPQRLVNANLGRGSVILQTQIEDAQGKGFTPSPPRTSRAADTSA